MDLLQQSRTDIEVLNYGACRGTRAPVVTCAMIQVPRCPPCLRLAPVPAGSWARPAADFTLTLIDSVVALEEEQEEVPRCPPCLRRHWRLQGSWASTCLRRLHTLLRSAVRGSWPVAAQLLYILTQYIPMHMYVRIAA
ncbi:unnamed protein product [Symbiodinium sp. CCMP2456]|nr:unnamed protein product [Symbiodinium sp. CCMP2456]